MNYTTKSAVPTAHITKKKSRLKVYNGNNIFLNDGDNFEFELHNPTTKSVLVRIKLNGGYISASGVIVKPGQRVFLERFLDSNNKFEFSTYNVKDTSENRSAIDLNGDVRIEFYNQQDIQIYPHLNGGNWYNGWTSINTGTPKYNSVYFNTTNTAGLSGTLTSTSNTMLVNCSNTFEKSIETGRIEKGKESTQDFIVSDESFSSLVSKEYQFKMLPLSQKNKTSDELRQYCTECGTKVKSKYKFCPSCGNKI